MPNKTDFAAQIGKQSAKSSSINYFSRYGSFQTGEISPQSITQHSVYFYLVSCVSGKSLKRVEGRTQRARGLFLDVADGSLKRF